jgi:hypothetical protein
MKTWDEVHPWIQTFDLYDQGYGVPKARCNRIRYREGGPFAKYTCEVPVQEVQGSGVYFGRDFRSFGGYASVYAGGFCPANWDHGYSASDFMNAGTDVSAIGPDEGSAAPYGPQAWSKFRPKTQSFDAMQFLFDDVKDLPQQLATTSQLLRDSHGRWLRANLSRAELRALRDKVLMPRNVAEQYLNYEFGWAPFIGDLRKLYTAYSRMNRAISQLHRDNNRWIHRGGTVLTVREESDVTTIADFAGVVYPALTSDFYSDPGGVHVVTHLYRQTEMDVWFSGNFKYYIPAYDHDPSHADAYEVMGQLLHYYGVGVSPQVIWELTPWTWLVDWFANVGENINNFSAMLSEGIVSRDAYVMNHRKVRVVNDSTIYLNGGPVKCFWYQNIETKKRTVANPYGFGLTMDGLSGRQLAILASLGLTRGSTRGLSGGPS